jgi:hypothetical protein
MQDDDKSWYFWVFNFSEFSHHAAAYFAFSTGLYIYTGYIEKVKRRAIEDHPFPSIYSVPYLFYSLSIKKPKNKAVYALYPVNVDRTRKIENKRKWPTG